jgi:hypothetical protein
MTPATRDQRVVSGGTPVRYQLVATAAASMALVALATLPPSGLSTALAVGVLASGVTGLRRLLRERDPLEAWTVAGLVAVGLLIGIGMTLNVLPDGLDRLNLTTALATVSTGAVALAACMDGGRLPRAWSRPAMGRPTLARLRSTLRRRHLIWPGLALLVGAAVVPMILADNVRTERATLRPSTTQLYLRLAPDEQIVVANQWNDAHRYRLVRTAGGSTNSSFMVLGPSESRAVAAIRPAQGQVTYELFDLDAAPSAPVASLRFSAVGNGGGAPGASP